MIDTHCHLDQMEGAGLESWFSQGLEAIVAPAMGMDSLERLLALAEQWPGRIYTAAGVHPENSPSLAQAEEMAKWIDRNHRRIIAVGEVGLPWYSLPPGAPIPPESFAVLEVLVDCALRWDLPLILHAVHGAAAPCLELLCSKGVRRAVFHWLKAPEEVTKAILAAGFYVSVTPEVTALARDGRLAELAFPDRLLLETDGPEPLRVSRKGSSSPLWIADSINWLSARFGYSPSETEALLDANARAFFQIQQSVTSPS